MIDDYRSKTHGRWQGKRAFLWHGDVYLPVGTYGSWVKAQRGDAGFEPYSHADLMDPANRQDLKKIGGEYVARY